MGTFMVVRLAFFALAVFAGAAVLAGQVRGQTNRETKLTGQSSASAGRHNPIRPVPPIPPDTEPRPTPTPPPITPITTLHLPNAEIIGKLPSSPTNSKIVIDGTGRVSKKPANHTHLSDWE